MLRKLVFALALLLAAAVCASGGSYSNSGSSSAGEGAPIRFEGQVDIGEGRKIYLQCKGTGHPTIVLESGYHDNSVLWSEADVQPPAVGPAVMPGLSNTNRVCAYDRPGTLDYSKTPPTINTRSTSVPMPRSAAEVVNDLHAALAAARIPGPYVFVAHSLGGLFARLYAQSHPDQVVGLVLVDSFSPRMPEAMGEAWPAYRQLLAHPGTSEDTKPGFEVIDIDRSLSQLAAAPPLRPSLPLVVLSKTEPFPLPPSAQGFSSAQLEKAWNQTQNELSALEPQTPHILATGSDHYIQVRQPDLVIAATRLVIKRAGKVK